MPGIESTATTSWPSTRPPREAVDRARRGDGPDAARMPDLPHAAARRGHGRLHLPHPRRSRGLEDALPDPAAARPRSSRSWPTVGAELDAIEAEIDAVVDDALAVRRDQPLARSRDRDPRSYSPSRVARDRVAVRRAPPNRQPRNHATCRPRSKACPRRWRATRRSSCWAKASASAAATSRRRPASTSCYGPVRLCDTPICERGFVGLAAGPP